MACFLLPSLCSSALPLVLRARGVYAHFWLSVSLDNCSSVIADTCRRLTVKKLAYAIILGWRRHMSK